MGGECTPRRGDRSNTRLKEIQKKAPSQKVFLFLWVLPNGDGEISKFRGLTYVYPRFCGADPQKIIVHQINLWVSYSTSPLKTPIHPFLPATYMKVVATYFPQLKLVINQS